MQAPAPGTISRREWLRRAGAIAGACAVADVTALGGVISGTRLSLLTREERLRSLRIAPGHLPLTRPFLERQRCAGFNTVLLSDIASFDPFTGEWIRVDVSRIAAELSLAREFDMSVIVCIPAALHDLRTGSSTTATPAPVFEPWAGRGAADLASMGTRRIIYLSDAEFRGRIQQWQSEERGEIVGHFFSGDDPFLMRLEGERQRQWYSAARSTAPDVAVLGLTGEACLQLPLHEALRYWAPDACDAVVHQNYPFNQGKSWRGRSLDQWSSADPDGDLADYEGEYLSRMTGSFFKDLRGEQLIIPIVQTFYYAGEPREAIPRARDIELQVRLTNRYVRETLGQKDNSAMGYFYAGSTAPPDPYPMPKGIDDVPEWGVVVKQTNRMLAALERRRRRDGRGRE